MVGSAHHLVELTAPAGSGIESKSTPNWGARAVDTLLRRSLPLAVLAAAALLALSLAACGSAEAPADGRARVLDVRALGPRLRDLTIESPALGRRARARLLLPSRYRAEPHRHWPVLWLLHGCCDSYRSWTRSTDVDQLAELRNVLVVMPEAGDVGFYSDWYNGGQDGSPRWETFHLTELRRLLERHWRAGGRRVVAGVSMGGFGAMAYAARHRGMFRAAASYSGLLHTRYQGGPVAEIGRA